VVQELLERTELDHDALDEVIWGAVIPPTYTPNIAREVVLSLALPARIPGFSLGRACTSSFQSVTSGVESILAGTHEVVIAGGAESLSHIPIQYSERMVDSLLAFRKARSVQGRVKALSRINPAKDLLPRVPELAEQATGLTMGQHAEDMARKWGITRKEQDEFAVRSHHLAAAALADGRLTKEFAAVFAPPDAHPVFTDNGVRADANMEAMSKLKPSFDKKYGTLTPGNSSPLTDGASAVLLMSEEKAKALGYKPKAFIKAWAYAALDPNQGLLMGPAYAVPKVLDRAGLTLKDMDLVDMHEAFAAQVLCNLRAFESKEFAKENLGRDKPIGALDMNRFNVAGGSIAIGHPFGATGGRMITTMANELQRRNGKYALLTACAAGAMGGALILERN